MILSFIMNLVPFCDIKLGANYINVIGPSAISSYNVQDLVPHTGLEPPEQWI